LQEIPESLRETVLAWRNEPEVRAVMFTGHEISLEEHLAWWERLQRDSSRQALLYTRAGEAAGVVTYYQLDDPERHFYWGFHLASASEWTADERLDAWLGIEQEATRHAFMELGCEELLCETLSRNEMVIRMHEKVGFRTVRSFQRDKDGESVEVTLMALERREWEQRQSADLMESLAFLGSANWDPIAFDLAERYRKLTGDSLRIERLPFGQYRPMLFDAKSRLRTRPPKTVVFCERIEDLLPSVQGVVTAVSLEWAKPRLDEYLDTIRAARSLLGDSWILVLDFAPVRPLPTSLSDASYSSDGPFAWIGGMNRRLEEACAGIGNCRVVRLSAETARVGTRNADPGKYWHLARLPFSGELGKALSDRLIATLLARHGRTARCLVLDLDNTLWGGVLGEDGIEGIRLGGDHPGNVYVQIQEVVKALKERGVVLAVCSKNTESLALEAIDEHPSMVIRRGDLAGWRINWRDKADNVLELSEELSLAPANLCVIDDSPHERESLRQRVPSLIIPELPTDPSAWPEFLLSFPLLQQERLTDEDLARADRYRARSEVKRREGLFETREAFLRSLGMRVRLSHYCEANKYRILQLLGKTNQFNATTRRHGEADLERLLSEGACVLGISLEDRLTQEETIGVLILDQPPLPAAACIESFLLSCRVLGRDLEVGVLAWACRYLRQRGYPVVRAPLIETPRNQPVRPVYPAFGFRRGDGGVYEMDLRETNLEAPTTMEVIFEDPAGA
jgi:UDP-4-amino-4,6-dideoxy-N-acetyl-beta-L-altrosamine N-acetyltransferase